MRTPKRTLAPCIAGYTRQATGKRYFSTFSKDNNWSIYLPAPSTRFAVKLRPLALRANLFTKGTNLFCRLPLLTLFYVIRGC